MITENNTKYVMPPSLELINSVVEKFKVSEAQFERFFGISHGTIKKVRNGERELPSKYWHLFYDPQYNAVKRRDSMNSVTTKPVPEMVPKITSNKPDKSKNGAKPDPKLNRLLS